MTANCTRWPTRESTLAPTSSRMTAPPRAVGNAAASAGRLTDGSVPSVKRATVMTAPVLPALTKASACPSRTRRSPTWTELSRFFRKACAGASVIVMTSGAGTSSSGRLRCRWRASSWRTASGCPTSSTRTPSSRAAATAPSTSTRGAWSDPIASNTTVVMGIARVGIPVCGVSRSGLRRQDSAAAIVTAVRTGLVRQLHLLAVRAPHHIGRRQEMMGPTLVLARLRMPTLGIGHGRLTQIRDFRLLRSGCSAQRSPAGSVLLRPLQAHALQWSQPWVQHPGCTATLLAIQIGAAMRAQPPAVAPADHLHWNSQIDLLGQNVGQKQSIPLEKSNFRLLETELHLLLARRPAGRAVDEVEIPAQVLVDGFQAAGAGQLEPGVQRTENMNLAIDQLGGGLDGQRLDLTKLRRVEVQAARGIRLADRQSAHRKFMDIKEHVRASVVIIRRTAPQSRKQMHPAAVRSAG